MMGTRNLAVNGGAGFRSPNAAAFGYTMLRPHSRQPHSPAPRRGATRMARQRHPPAIRMTPQHDPDARRFTITEDGHTALLAYALTDDTVVFTETFVPPEWRGRGVAEQLVKTGLAWAEDSGLRIASTCSYVTRYLERRARPAK
jgi:hypothetical protein